MRLKALGLQLSKEKPIFIPVFIQPNGNYSKDVIISMRTWFTGPTAQKQGFPMVSFIHPNPFKTHYLINQLTVVTHLLQGERNHNEPKCKRNVVC